MSRLKINSRRNSKCGSAKLAELDWSNWYTDDSGGGRYLHVAGRDGETFHRVFCRRQEKPKICLVDGELMWVVENKKGGA